MATNGLMGAHDLYSNRIDAFDVNLTITGAADVAANGYTVGGLWEATAVRTAEGKVLVKLTGRTFPSLLQVYPTIRNSTIGKTARCYHDFAATDTVASGGAEIGLIFVVGTNTDTDPDSTTTELTFRFKASAVG